MCWVLGRKGTAHKERPINFLGKKDIIVFSPKKKVNIVPFIRVDRVLDHDVHALVYDFQTRSIHLKARLRHCNFTGAWK